MLGSDRWYPPALMWSSHEPHLVNPRVNVYLNLYETFQCLLWSLIRLLQSGISTVPALFTHQKIPIEVPQEQDWSCWTITVLAGCPVIFYDIAHPVGVQVDLGLLHRDEAKIALLKQPNRGLIAFEYCGGAWQAGAHGYSCDWLCFFSFTEDPYTSFSLACQRYFLPFPSVTSLLHDRLNSPYLRKKNGFLKWVLPTELGLSLSPAGISVKFPPLLRYARPFRLSDMDFLPTLRVSPSWEVSMHFALLSAFWGFYPRAVMEFG